MPPVEDVLPPTIKPPVGWIAYRRRNHSQAQVDRAGGRQMLRISDTVEERLLPPVICIDAAEELMRWPDPASLATLLRFLVGISSERRQAHVVLVTSDAKMQTWLKESKHLEDSLRAPL